MRQPWYPWSELQLDGDVHRLLRFVDEVPQSGRRSVRCNGALTGAEHQRHQFLPPFSARSECRVNLGTYRSQRAAAEQRADLRRLESDVEELLPGHER